MCEGGGGVGVEGGSNSERKKLRKAADDSVSAAEDIALKDTTRDADRLRFKAGRKKKCFLDDQLPLLRASEHGWRWVESKWDSPSP